MERTGPAVADFLQLDDGFIADKFVHFSQNLGEPHVGPEVFNLATYKVVR